MFSEFFDLKACKVTGVGIVVAGTLRRGVKPNVSVFIKDFCLNVEIDFRELIKKK